MINIFSEHFSLEFRTWCLYSIEFHRKSKLQAVWMKLVLDYYRSSLYSIF